MELLAQKDNKQYFERAVANNSLHHCYLFHGKKGTGKKTLAEQLIKYMLCGSWNCKCRTCENIEKRNHPDVSFYYNEDAIVKLDIVNEFKKTALYSPIEGKQRIVVLAGVDRLNAQGANMLLTLIEEPPPYLKIFLLSDNITKVIPTITSRSIPIMLKPLSIKEISQYLLEKYQVKEEQANIIGVFSEGSLGQAIELVESDFINIRENFYNLLWECHIKGTDYVKINNFMEKNDVYLILDLIEFWLRDLLYLKSGQNRHILINKDYYDKLLNVDVNNPEKIINRIKIIRNSLKNSINTMLNLEVVFNALQEV